MLHATPSLSLAKFLWSKPQPLQSSPMTVSANGEANPEPMKLTVCNDSLDNIDSSRNGTSRTPGIKISSEEESNALKIAGLKEFWNLHMKSTESKCKQFYEQISSSYQHRGAGYDIETGEVDWGALMERVAYRWRLSQEKPGTDNMSIEEWQKLQEINVHLRPWFIYKTCGLYSRILYDPENRPIFQEFDFC